MSSVSPESAESPVSSVSPESPVSSVSAKSPVSSVSPESSASAESVSSMLSVCTDFLAFHVSVLSAMFLIFCYGTTKTEVWQL